MHDQDIGDGNVERLVGTAYKPEAINAAFAKRIEKEMCALALARSVAPANLPGMDSPNLQVIRKRLGWAMGLAASVAAGFLVYYARTHRVDYVMPPNVQTKEIIESINKIRPTTLGDNKLSMGLTARPRVEAPAAPPLEIGATLVTWAGERRRVTLKDGSVLYLNQETAVKQVAPRRLELTKGEVYLEVAAGAMKNLEGATFLVTTPGRVVTALGTHFGVQADDRGAGVIVTQGKVKVSGIDEDIHAGQQLLPGASTLAAAPRATHVLDWTRALMTAAESPLVPCSKYAGGALLALDPFGQEVTLTLRKFHVDVHIEDGFARTTIDQTYFNNNSQRMEGTFYFPLPPDASLSRLAMYVEDGAASRLMEGGMAERDHARNVFESIMHQRRDPALLEWVDGSTFKMRVFPLEGRKEKRILLSYTQRLSSLYGVTRYRFPAGHSMELVRDWSFEARIKKGVVPRITSASHPEMKINSLGADKIARATAQNVKPNRDVTLEIHDTGEARTKDIAQYTSFVHENQHYVMLKVRPILAEMPQRERRDWVILFETAANRDPLLARAQIDIVKNLLENVEHDDTFVVLTANTRTGFFDTKARPATTENVAAAIKFLEGSHLIGALDLNKALATARAQLSGAKNPYLLHVGAGIAAMGERQEDILARQIPDNTRYVGIGVGKRWSRSFMKMAAERTGGFFTQINPDEPIAWRTFELLATLATPRLMELRVVDADEKVPFLCETTALAQGEEVCALARTQGHLPEKLILSGKLNGRPFVKTLEVKGVVPGAGYLPRTWAKLEIDRLLADGAEKNKKAIIDLSMAMYVMTPFTSLLVLENDQDYLTYKVDRGRKDHWAMYDSPPRIPTVYEPDPNQAVWNGVWNNPPAAAAKKTAQDILATILVRIPPPLLVMPGQEHNKQPAILTAQQWFGLNYAYQENVQAGRDDVFLTTDIDLAALEFDTDITYNVERWVDLSIPSGWPTKKDQPALLPLTSDFEWKVGKRGRSKGEKRLELRREMTGITEGWISSERLGDLGFWPRMAGGAGLDLNGDIFQANTIDFFPPGLGLIVRGKSGIRTSIAGGIIGGKEKQLEALMLDARMKGLDQLITSQEKDRKKKYDPDSQEYWLQGMTLRLQNGASQRNLLYQRPQVQADSRFFSDLTAFAPGLHTNLADIYATLEKESTEKQPLPGKIDPRTRKLIDKARSAGFQTLTVPGHGKEPDFTVTFNGAGQFAYERVLDTGLHETVLCDGTTLWTLYPEIGLGGRRPFSRHHHDEIADLVPWFLPSAEDLARGADLQLVDDATVAIVSRQPAHRAADGKRMPGREVHLVFADDGRLAERRVIETPSRKVLIRQTFDARGLVKIINPKDNKVLVERHLKISQGQTPNLKADTKDLLVMEFPTRTFGYLFTKISNWNGSFAKVDAGLMEQLFIAYVLSGDGHHSLKAFGERFHAEGDHRLGFYTLYNLTGTAFAVDTPYNWDNKKISFNIEKEHPQNALATYLALHQKSLNQPAAPFLENLPGPKDGFIQELARFRQLWAVWINDHPSRHGNKNLQEENTKALKFIQETGSPLYAWAIIEPVTRYGQAHSEDFHQALNKIHMDMGNQFGLSYFARYEQARSLFTTNKNQLASKAFQDLYLDAFKAGALPPIDSGFVQSLKQMGKDGANPFGNFLLERLDDLVKEERLTAATLLALQAWQLGEQNLAEELFRRVQTSARFKDKNAVVLSGIEYLWQTGQFARADVLLQQILIDSKIAQRAGAWRLSAALAQRRGLLARSVAALEKAMDLEYRALPEIINLNTVRADYRGLLNHYQQLATAITMLETVPAEQFLGKVVRAADRWRSLDPDNVEVCQLTGRIMQTMGARELAWDYATTPIGMKPNEAAPWLGLAGTFRQEAEFELADRAYAMAFEAEPTNAEILWNRAQNLQQFGKLDQARALYRQLVDGSWQPRFQWLQQQARGFLK